MFSRTLFISYFVPVCTGMVLAALAFGLGFYGVLGAFFLSALVVVLALGVGDGIGGRVANRLYGTGHRPIPLVEQLAGELNRVRLLKRSGEPGKALALINEVLEQLPEHPEALYLKAEILWECYGNRRETMKCLREVLRLTTVEAVVHRWARALLEEVAVSPVVP